jgi:uncharacterized protein (TIGR02594 family)
MQTVDKVKLPAQYSWLLREKTLPPILSEAMKLYGVYEFNGQENNPVIINWADEIGGWIGYWYEQDSIPWCGLFMGICAKRAGVPFNQNALQARAWRGYGEEPIYPCLGDVLIFERENGAHVGLYVGEDHGCFHVLGGNQNDSVSIMRIEKTRLIAARRPEYQTQKPVKRFFLSTKGEVSTNEA